MIWLILSSTIIVCWSVIGGFIGMIHTSEGMFPIRDGYPDFKTKWCKTIVAACVFGPGFIVLYLCLYPLVRLYTWAYKD
jgi:hypothetical protein